jgi:hypothetical protein
METRPSAMECPANTYGISIRRQRTSVGLPSRRGGTAPYRNFKFVTKRSNEPLIWMDPLDKQYKRWNTYVRFGTWNVGSMCRAGSIMRLAKELYRYILDLVAVQESRCEGVGTVRAEYTFPWKQR